MAFVQHCRLLDQGSIHSYAYLLFAVLGRRPWSPYTHHVHPLSRRRVHASISISAPWILRMIHPHDPLRQINYLQQCLSNDKRPLAIFLGAGCPLAIRTADGDPLIPDIEGMTGKARTHLESSLELAPLFKIVEEHFVTDGCLEPNIENLLSHIRGLRLVAGKDKARGLTANDLDQLDMGICAVITDLAKKDLPNTATPYHATALWTDAVGREHPC